MENLANIVISIISTIGAVMVAYIPFYYNMKRHINRKTEETKLFSDISTQKLNGLLTSVIHSFDNPMWLKVAVTNEKGDMEFRMSELNSKYCERYGVSRMGYIGKTDEEVGWDREEAQRFKEHDLSVWASGEPKTFFELVNGEQRCFRKVRVQNLEGTIKGILGYEIDYRYDDCQ